MSVIIPTYQSGLRISAAISRLQRQTYTDFEIIVVNDGSTDDTSSVVDRSRTSDGRVRLVEQDRKGIAAARNRGVELARGEVVAFLDDDDLWLPEKLELQLNRLDSSRSAAVVSCFSALVDPAGHLLGWRWGGLSEGNVYREMLEWDMVSGGSVALVSRRSFEEAGGFDESVPDRADWDLWIRLSRRHHFACVPRTLVGYTRRPGSVSTNYDRMVEHGRAVLAKACREDPTISEDECRAFMARDLFGTACLSLADDQHSAAWQYMRRALESGPRIIVARPRRVGVMLMLGLSATLPPHIYRDVVIAAMSRMIFRIKAGAPFDTLAGIV